MKKNTKKIVKNDLYLPPQKVFNMITLNKMNKIFTKSTISLILIVLMSFVANRSNASHVMGADISYKCINTSNGTYKFRVTLYRSCTGIFYGGEQLQIRTSTVSTSVPLNLISTEEVTPICKVPDVATPVVTNCPSGAIVNNIKGVQRNIYEVTYTIGKNKGIAYVGWTTCCRNAEITTGPANDAIWVQAVINTNYTNNSVIFTSPPIPYWCANTKSTYNHGAVDSFDSRYITVNGQQVIQDSFVYILFKPFNAEAASASDAVNLLNPTVSLNPPLNAQNFLYTTNGVTISQTTGNITCVPSQEQDAVMAMAVAEYRAVPNASGTGYTRVFVGYVTRDIQFTVKSTCFPIVNTGILEDSLKSANYINSNYVDVCGSRKTKIVFKINAPMGQTLKSKIISTPNVASVLNFKYTQKIIRVANTDTLFGTIEFDSTVGIGQEKFVLEAFYCNTIGIKVSQFYDLTINFRPAIYVTKDTGYYCDGGKPYRIYVKGATKYRWTPQAGIVKSSGPDSSWVDVAPALTTTYQAKAIEGFDSTRSCNKLDSILVVRIPKFNYTITPKVVDLCLSDSFKINITPQITDTPYTYTWTNTGGMLFDPATNVSTTSVSSPFGKVIDSRKLYVDIQSRYQCILTDSIQVNLKGVVPIATAKSARPLVCPGDTTMLTVSITPKVTGPTVYNANKPETMYAIIGSGLTYPTGCVSSTPTTCYPSLYGTIGAGNSSQMRIIYKKSELNAAGIYAGTIRSIAFNILSLNVPDLDAFEIKMGRITGTNSILTVPMFTVYNSKPITISSGWNKYTLDRGFDWDGVSNIVIELSSYKIIPVSATNEYNVLGSISSNEVSYRYSNTAGVKSTDLTTAFTGSGLASTKPEIRIYTTGVDSTDVVYLNNSIWDPSYAVTKIGNPRGIATINQKDSFFVATIGTAQCFDTAGVKVKIDNTFSVKASGSKVICTQTGVPNTVNLTSVITGGSNTKIKWTCNLPNAGIPSNDSTANITVTPTTKGIFKYVVKISDLPCTATDTVIVTIDDSLKFSLLVDTPVCNANNGKLRAVLPQGTTKSQFDFNWTGVTPTPSTTQDSIANLYGNPNTYSLQLVLKSNPTCKGTVTNVLTAKQYILNISMANSPILCNGGTSDSIEATTTSAQSPGPYKYTWSPGTAIDSNSKLYNKVKGTYLVTATDRITGCQGTKSLVVSEPALLTLNFINVKNISCKGGNDGRITAIATGGDQTNGSYIFQWKRGNGTSVPTFNDLLSQTADTFTCTVTDGNGCTVTKGVRITEPATSVQVAMSKDNATVVNGTDGRAIANASGGTSPYQYRWGLPYKPQSPPKTIPDTFGSRGKGWAFVTVTDNNGCIINDSIFIKDIECDIRPILLTQNILCYRDSSGMIQFGAQDLKNLTNTFKYYYTLYQGSAQTSSTLIKLDSSALPSPPDTLIKFRNLKANIYNMRIQTDRGCDTTVYNIQLTENQQINLSVTPTNPSCAGYSDGKAKVTVSDTLPPYLYKWSTATGYTSTDSAVGLSVAANNGTFVTVMNSVGCTQSAAIELTDPQVLNASFQLDSQVSCFGKSDGGGKIIVSNPTITTNPISYLNKPGSNTVTTSNVVEGLKKKTGYNVDVQYQNIGALNTCITKVPFDMTEPDTLILTSTIDSVTCSYNADGKIKDTVTGGNTGSKSFVLTMPGGATKTDNQISKSVFSNLAAGTYSVVVTDARGCTDQKINLKVEKPDSFIIGITPTNTPCYERNSGKAEVTTFVGGNTTPASSYATRWFVTDNITNITSVYSDSAKNNHNKTGLKGLSTYKAIVYDIKGCKAERSVLIDTDYVFKITEVLVDSAKCYGSADGKITISKFTPNKAPIVYQWSNQAPNSPIMTAGKGTYTVLATDNNGCTATSQATINQPSEIVIVGKSYPATCNGYDDGSIKVNLSGGTPPYSNPAWSNPTQFSDSAVNLSAGTYTVSVTDRNSCVKTETFTVQQPVPFLLSVENLKQITCYAANDGAITLKTQGGFPVFKYNWSNTTQNVISQTNLGPAMYRVTATDAHGCTAVTNAEVIEPRKLEFEEIRIDSVSCPGYNDGVIDIYAKGGTVSNQKQYEYSIDGGTTYFSSNKHIKLPAGDYNVIIRDNNNCFAARKVNVGSPEELSVVAYTMTNDTIKMGTEMRLYFSQSTVSGKLPIINKIVWTPYESLSCSDCKSPFASPYITTDYNLSVYYHKNCLATSSTRVNVYEPQDFYVPNAFSPGNGDGVNDILYLYGNGIKSIKFAVYNRWGEKVFESDHISRGWDGRYKGDYQPNGIYTYIAEVTYLNNFVKNKKGSITLLR